MRATFLILVLFASGACTNTGTGPSGAASRSTPLSVCELLAALPSYQDKVVTVRGIYYFGLREDNCKSTFVSQGYSWPSALDVVLSDSPPRFGDRPTAFQTDLQAWHDFQNFAIQEGTR